MIRLLLALPLLVLGACQSTVPAGETVGEPIASREIVSLAVVHETPPQFFERTLLVEAEAVAVCEKAGCWMKVQDQDATAMVRWESGCGGKYKFPGEIVGKRILIQGSFYPKTISEEDAQHLESEAPEGVTIEREGYEFNASAILIPTGV